jgi:hypothetical protein
MPLGGFAGLSGGITLSGLTRFASLRLRVVPSPGPSLRERRVGALTVR